MESVDLPLDESSPYAPHRHPAGLEAVPSVQARHDAELAEQSDQVTIPDDDELGELKKPDLADLADRLGLDTSGKRETLIERIRVHRDTRPDETPSD